MNSNIQIKKSEIKITTRFKNNNNLINLKNIIVEKKEKIK